MPESPAITVVTPVFNGARFLRETIESVLAQTRKDFEYILVDGGSTDESREIIREYAIQDARIQTIFEPDDGIYDAVFKGIMAGSAPICCWINSDDKLMPWAFELVAEEMTIRKIHWLTAIPALWDPNGRLFWVGSALRYPRVLVRSGWFHGRALGWIPQDSTFFTRDLLSRVPIEKINAIRRTRLAGDFLLWAEFARHERLPVLPTVIGGFRCHAANRSASAEYFSEIRQAGFWIPPGWLEWVFLPLRLGLFVWFIWSRLPVWKQKVSALRPEGETPA